MRLSKPHKERGAALIEAALVLPILLLLTFGIWTTARAWNIHNSMEHAAREAARYGATIDPWVDYAAGPPESGSSVDIRAVADADMTNSAIDTSQVNSCIELVVDAASPTCDLTHSNNTSTDQVFVKLTYPNYTLNFLFFSATIDLEAVAISRFEAA